MKEKFFKESKEKIKISILKFFKKDYNYYTIKELKLIVM